MTVGLMVCHFNDREVTATAVAKQSDGKGEQTAPDTHAWPIRRPAVLTCSWCLCAQPVHCTPCRLRRMLRPDDQARAWRRSQGRTHRPARHSTVRSLRGACAAFDQGERQCRPDESERRRRGGHMHMHMCMCMLTCWLQRRARRLRFAPTGGQRGVTGPRPAVVHADLRRP